MLCLHASYVSLIPLWTRLNTSRSCNFIQQLLAVNIKQYKAQNVDEHFKYDIDPAIHPSASFLLVLSPQA